MGKASFFVKAKIPERNKLQTKNGHLNNAAQATCQIVGYLRTYVLKLGENGYPSEKDNIVGSQLTFKVVGAIFN